MPTAGGGGPEMSSELALVTESKIQVWVAGFNSFLALLWRGLKSSGGGQE